MLNYRRLIVYQRAVQYDELAERLIRQVQRFDRSLADHLRRSGNSLITAIAEGGSADQPRMKAMSYRVAKGEAEECGVCWEKSVRRGWTPHQETMHALELLDQIASMLAQLIMRFDEPRELYEK
jgi:four helix bundle protein